MPAITNVSSSTMARRFTACCSRPDRDRRGGLPRATSQLAALFMVALQLGSMRGFRYPAKNGSSTNWSASPQSEPPEKESEVREIARNTREVRTCFSWAGGCPFRRTGGRLKLKEVSYIHAQVCRGEMKHGPIALLEPEMPVLASYLDSLYEKTLSNMQEIKARNASLIAVCTEGDSLVPEQAGSVIEIPRTVEEFTPFLTVIPLQFLSFHIGSILGREIDQPRNLAKSVTVE